MADSERDCLLVFAGETHYPLGGYEDCKGMFTSEAQAMEHIAKIHCEWWQVCRMDELIGMVLINSGKRK